MNHCSKITIMPSFISIYLFNSFIIINDLKKSFKESICFRLFGPKLGLIIYSTVAAIGMVVFVIGGNTDFYILMLVGRFILG